MLTIDLMGRRPVSKKNSSVRTRTGLQIPSKAYREYLHWCKGKLTPMEHPISDRINLKCVYYLPLTKEGKIPKTKFDLCNFIGSTCDVLTECGIIEDDNCTIVHSHDGSRISFVPFGQELGARIYISEV